MVSVVIVVVIAFIKRDFAFDESAKAIRNLIAHYENICCSDDTINTANVNCTANLNKIENRFVGLGDQN